MDLCPRNVEARDGQFEAIELEPRRDGATDQRIIAGAARGLPVVLRARSSCGAPCVQIGGQKVIASAGPVSLSLKRQDQRRAGSGKARSRSHRRGASGCSLRLAAGSRCRCPWRGPRYRRAMFRGTSRLRGGAAGCRWSMISCAVMGPSVVWGDYARGRTIRYGNRAVQVICLAHDPDDPVRQLLRPPAGCVFCARQAPVPVSAPRRLIAFNADLARSLLQISRVMCRKWPRPLPATALPGRGRAAGAAVLRAISSAPTTRNWATGAPFCWVKPSGPMGCGGIFS